MHDQRKVRQSELDEKQKQFVKEKIQRFKSLYEQCFHLRDSGHEVADVETMSLLTKLLEINPENYSMYAYRRCLLMLKWKRLEKEEEGRGKFLGDSKIEEREVSSPINMIPTQEEEDEKRKKKGGDHCCAEKEQQQRPSTTTKENDLQQELEFNTKVITKDYKCYAAWLHRKWIFSMHAEDEEKQKEKENKRKMQIEDFTKKDEKGEEKEKEKEKEKKAATVLLLEILLKEKKSCESILKLDERNFHAWGYRRWVSEEIAKRMATKKDNSHDDDKEMEYTLTRIGQNFSNYSAWHNRALILGKLGIDYQHQHHTKEEEEEERGKEGGGGFSAKFSPSQFLKLFFFSSSSSSEKNDAESTSWDFQKFKKMYAEEIQLVMKAFYCDAQDQSAWLYGRWLMAQIHTPCRLLQQYLSSPQSLSHADFCRNNKTSQEDEAMTQVLILSEETKKFYEEMEKLMLDGCDELYQAERAEIEEDEEVQHGSLPALKWPLWMELQVFLLTSSSASHQENQTKRGKTEEIRSSGEGDPNRVSPEGKRVLLLKNLIKYDPQRRGYYESML